MYSLQLLANPQGWRAFMLRKNDPAFAHFSQQVWQRDQFSCQYCGFQAQEGQEVINLNHDYTQNRLSNLVTACIFCAQCGFLESLGAGSYGGGILIYLPECSQMQLNGFCHALFAAMVRADGQQDVAQQYYRSLKLRVQVVEEQLGNGMSEPTVFGQLLVESGAKPMDNTLIAGLRLLPARAIFKPQVEHWLASCNTSFSTA